MTEQEMLKEALEWREHIRKLITATDDELYHKRSKVFDWLINRVKELEEERDEWKDTAQSYYVTNQELREQNERYKQALEEINRLGWDSESFGGGYDFEGEIHAQAIKIAYEALEGSE